MNHSRSAELFEQASRVIPGGVNSPVRAFQAVGGKPIFMERAECAYLWDVDGNKYIDYVGSWGPFILGHGHRSVVKAIQDQAVLATSFGAPTALETELATAVQRAMPAIEMLRLVNSGTEATMSAIRLARAFTKRNKIIKFEGCYHGHGDSFLIKAGSGALTLGEPSSPGVTPGTAQDTLNARYNDLSSVAKLIEKYPNEVAAIIVEPVAGNMGVVLPAPNFLQELRSLATSNNIVLIFDEVMTGFRVHHGGAQSLYGIQPDLTTLGKIIGGGLPVGAFGGRKDIMQMLAPSGPVYQAGTLSGNPLAMTAGIATLRELEKPGFYDSLEKKSAFLEDGFERNIQNSHHKIFQTRVGSMLCQFFTNRDVTDFESAVTSDTSKYAAYFHGMLERGIYLAPSQYEAMFVSAAHSEEDLERTVEAHREVLSSI